MFLLTKYVDDVLIIARNVHLGCYWNGTKITWDEQILDRHIKDKMDRTELTLDIMKQIANSLCEFLEFTGEASCGGQPIPCLDSQLWVGQPEKDGPWYDEEGAPGDHGDKSKVEYHTVLYKFYKKPMAARLTTLARSAAPESSKVATATAEVLRRTPALWYQD